MEGPSSSQNNFSNTMEYAKFYQSQPLKKNIKLLDGSFSSQMRLYRKVATREHLYRLNECYQESVYKVHIDFLEAGANIIRTNTTRAFLSAMKNKFIYTEETYEKLINAAVSIAKRAVDNYNKKTSMFFRPACVVGSCGHFEPIEPMNRDEIKDEYRRLIRALSRAGIDMFCMESIQSTQEADLLIELLQELPEERTGAWMMFKPNKIGLLKDESNIIDTAVRYYRASQVFAVGINCVSSREVNLFLNLMKEKGQHLQNKIPLIVCTNKSNASSKPWSAVEVTSKHETIKWAEMNISYIGGCCGVAAEDVKFINDELKRCNKSPE